MPTSSLKPAMIGNPMSLSFPSSYRPNMVMIHPFSVEAHGDELMGGTTANLTSTTPAGQHGCMITLNDSFLVRKVWWANGTIGGSNNADVAVYSEDGATRILFGNGALMSGSNTVQEIDISDVLVPRGRYWMVYSQSGVTNGVLAVTMAVANVRAAGFAFASGLTVPIGSTWTPSAATSGIVPLFGIAGRTQVA